MLHVRCRNAFYPASNVRRLEVPDERVAWHTPWLEYDPPEYTSETIIGKSWADPPIERLRGGWNVFGNHVNRLSYTGQYMVENLHPLNPMGRTGLRGRGLLGRWGPNHAADTIVTRWKKLSEDVKVYNAVTNKPVLQFVAIKRRDNGEWAIPGGMVDAGEKVTAALKREFAEEALNYFGNGNSDGNNLRSLMDAIFANGVEVYKGYVDDPRNTDNAWMETIAMHFHHENDCMESLPLHAGDDAVGVQWLDLDRNMRLYASHLTFFHHIVHRLNPHW